ALTAGLDLTFELAYESGELDFGSLVGEDFDTERSGPAARLGVRCSPIDPFELYVSTGTSPYGKLELSDGELDDATVVNAGLRWYFFPDLAAGLDYRGGDLSM